MLKSHYREIAENQDRLWWYLGMREINLSLLNTYLSKKRPLKILDAGCGPGAMLLALHKYGEVVGIDMSDEALKYARKRGNVQKGDVSNLKFPNSTFDLVICLDVLYHTWVKEENKALDEFNRVLKKGGILLIREPAYNWLRGKEDVGSLTQRRFSSNRLKLLIKKSSFEILKVTYANFFLFPVVFLLRIRTSLFPNNIKGSNDFSLPIPIINKLLLLILQAEAFLMRYISLPFGSSLICVARKK